MTGGLEIAAGSLQLKFTNTTFALPDPGGHLYDIDARTSISRFGSTELEGMITQGTAPAPSDVPLPAVAPAALLLLGGFGLRKRSAKLA
jgi:hypothetical protein